MPLATGQTLLNKYRIERMIGEGGFGYVYIAVDNKLGRRVAIKELKPELAHDKTMLGRFVGEAQAVAALDNPYIVRLLDYVEVGSSHYIVLEYMDGGNLADRIKKHRALSVSETIGIAVAVCDGLSAVHQLGIVHRDIKPSNVLLTSAGLAKIGDFGIAHVPSALSGVTSLTRTGTTMGTPWYMSPEQARGEKVDARGDLYSVGVMLYEMVSGQTYAHFTSDFLRDVELVKSQPPRPLPASVPQPLQQIIFKSLAKNPAQRFQSAAEMSSALRSLGSSVVRTSTPRPLDAGATHISPTRSTVPIALIGGASVIALLFLVILFGVFFRSTNQPPLSSPRVSNVTSAPIGVDASATQMAQSEFATRASLAQFATQTVAVQFSRATETAFAVRMFSTQTASAPTPTRTATSTPLPTQTPTRLPTQTPVPVFAFIELRTDPPNAAAGDPIIFVPVFNNTVGPREIRWRVELRDVDNNGRWDKPYWMSNPAGSLVQLGLVELRSNPPWRIPGSAGPRHFEMRVVGLDNNNQVVEHFKTPAGQSDFPLTLIPR